MSKQDRQGVRSPADLERKYNFGKTFAEVLGVAKNAQDAAEAAKQAIVDLNQEQIFNLLTNNGNAEGIYRDANGNVYINASYIVSGILKSLDSSKFYLDLDKGILKMDATELTISGNTVPSVSGKDDMPQGIYMGDDGKLYINLEYANAGFLSSDYITLRGLLEIWTNMGGSSYHGGYLGYAMGSKDGVPSDGVAIMNTDKSCCAIVTDNGVRLQAGDYDIHITKEGAAAINCANLKINGVEVVFTDNGDSTYTISGKD